MALSASTLKVGDTRTDVLVDNLTRTQIVQYAGVSGDYNPLHSDEVYATQAAGYPSVFAHGMLSMGYLGRLLTNWVPQRRIREYGVRFVAITQVGEAITCSGTVTELFDVNGERRARLSLQTTNQHGQVKLTGDAVVAIA